MFTSFEANVPEVTINFRSDGDVFKRRSKAKAWNEFKIYMNGIYRMNGLFTMKYRYPIARFLFRLMPPQIVKAIYGSGIRTKLLESKSEKLEDDVRFAIDNQPDFPMENDLGMVSKV